MANRKCSSSSNMSSKVHQFLDLYARVLARRNYPIAHTSSFSAYIRADPNAFFCFSALPRISSVLHWHVALKQSPTTPPPRRYSQSRGACAHSHSMLMPEIMKWRWMRCMISSLTDWMVEDAPSILSVTLGWIDATPVMLAT